MMEFNDYQRRAKTTAQYPAENRITYPMSMIAGEAGELIGAYSKILRGDRGDDDPARIIDSDPALRSHFIKELGDILWGIAILSDELGVSFDDVARTNLEKLESRSKRGVIKGSGDER